MTPTSLPPATIRRPTRHTYPQCRYISDTHDAARFVTVLPPRNPTGETQSLELRTGSGAVQVMIGAYALNTPVRVLQGYGFGGWVIVP